MGRGQLKGMWSQKRIVYSMEDMNDASERETLTSQELKRRSFILYLGGDGIQNTSRGVGCCSDQIRCIHLRRRRRWVCKKVGS